MNERGVSLVELCTVLAIMAIVVGVSVPGWTALVAKHRQRAVVTEIASELRMARQLAMARHERVRVVVNTANLSYARNVWTVTRLCCVVMSLRIPARWSSP